MKGKLLTTACDLALTPLQSHLILLAFKPYCALFLPQIHQAPFCLCLCSSLVLFHLCANWLAPVIQVSAQLPLLGGASNLKEPPLSFLISLHPRALFCFFTSITIRNDVLLKIIYLFIYFGCAGSSLWRSGSSLWCVGFSSCGMWGLSSPTRDRTPDPLHWECETLATGPPGKSL